MLESGTPCVAIVIPCFNEEDGIAGVIESAPEWVSLIVVVDDASTDGTASVVEELAATSTRIIFVRHAINQGVGGAMITGFREALKRSVDIVVKMDGDGQMSSANLPQLLTPLLAEECDVSKGNRFRDFAALRQMPVVRRIGNMGLSFLTKVAVGYWDLFDPCNGFVAINADTLRRVDLERLARDYFFETSLLAELYLAGAVVRDVDMPARYGAEVSQLSVQRVLFTFPGRLFKCGLRRIVLRHFLYDFTLFSVYALAGVPLLLGGMIYGGVNWYRYAQLGSGAPTGTVVISAMLIMIGFQLLLAAIAEDVRSVPRIPRRSRSPSVPT